MGLDILTVGSNFKAGNAAAPKYATTTHNVVPRPPAGDKLCRGTIYSTVFWCDNVCAIS